MSDTAELPDIPEVSTEAQRQALDAMSTELVQKLNRMIEEQDARVQAFAVQNPSLSSLPSMPAPIVPPQQEPPQEPRVAKPAARAAEHEPAGTPIHPPPVPAPARPKQRRQRQVAPNQEEKNSNIGSWVFFIVIVLIILRACTE